jgi:transposase
LGSCFVFMFMSDCQGTLMDAEGCATGCSPVVRKRHVRHQVLFRRAPDPAFALFDYSLEIPEGHLVRRMRDFLCALDLEVLESDYTDCGGVGYDPRDILGPILLGLKEGVRSGAALEQACRYDVRYRFLAGGHTPDRRTFQRLRKRFQPHLNSLQSSVIQKARRGKRGLGKEIAVDGTKMPGNSSAWKSKDGESPSDPDVRVMESHGRKCLGYNVQIALDTTGPERFILGCQVIQDQNDTHAMPKILQATREQLGDLPVQVLADKGYESPQSIAHLEDQGIECLICPSEHMHEALRENAEGVLVCPAGKPMVYTKTRSGKESKGKGATRSYDVYRPEGGCAGCPLRESCTFHGKELQVQPGTEAGIRFRNRDRFISQGGAGALIRRRMVELPFALMKRHTRFDRFQTRGLDNVQAELLLWVLSYNIFRLLKRPRRVFRIIWALFSPKRLLIIPTI